MEPAYCLNCKRETPHVVIADQLDYVKFDKEWFACYTCGDDKKRLYQGNRKLKVPTRINAEGKLIRIIRRSI